MKSLLSLFLAFLIFTGCNSSYDNTPNKSESAFNITLSPAFAAAPVTTIPVNSRIILHSSTALDPRTINENNIFIQDLSETRFPASITLVGLDIIVQPKAFLTANTAFTVVLTTAIHNSEGIPLSEKTLLSFSSGNADPDGTPPILADRLAKDGTTIEPQTILYFQFNEPISPLSINDTMVTVQNIVLDHTIQGTISVSGTLLKFTPDEAFEPTIPTDSAYTISIDMSGISDLAGNPITASSQVDNVSVDFALPVTTVALSAPTYDSYSQVYCIESTPSSSDSVVHLLVGGTNGLDIINFDLQNQTFSKLTQISAETVGAVYSVEINTTSKRLYLGSDNGLSIFDISSIDQPQKVGTFDTSYPVYGIDIYQDHAYLAASSEGLIDLNISDETMPRDIFTTNYFDSTAFDVAYHDNNILVADYQQELTQYDINGLTGQSWTQIDKGQVRTMIKHPSSSRPDDFLIASGIAGFKAFVLEVIGNTYYSNHTFAPSYVSKVVAKPSSSIYFNVTDIGLAELSQSNYSHQGYLKPSPFIDTVTFTQVNDNTFNNKYLILVDKNGRLYSMAR